jgi:hypothetical protein
MHLDMFHEAEIATWASQLYALLRDDVVEGRLLQELVISRFQYEIVSRCVRSEGDATGYLDDACLDGLLTASTGNGHSMIPVSDEVRVADPKEIYGRQCALSAQLLNARPSRRIDARPGEEGPIEVPVATHTAHDLIERHLP